MGKLVRDLILQIIEKDGRRPRTRILTTDEYRAALMDKFAEEARELRLAANVMDELCDLYELVAATAAAEGHSMAEVAELAERKRAERGGFERRIWLED